MSAAEQAASGQPLLRGWGAYCTGVMGMGRQADPGSANAEIFFMRAPARRLDHDYTVVGRVVAGLPAIRAVAVGEPPARPDRMVRVRVAADLPPSERPRIQVENEKSAAFASRMAKLKQKRGANFTICDVNIVSRIL